VAPRALTAAEIATRQRVLTEQREVAAQREAERLEQQKISIMSAAEEARRREAEEAKEAVIESKRAAEEARNPTPVETPKTTEPVRAADAAAPVARSGERPAVVTARPAPSAAETLRLKPGGRPTTADDEEDAPRGVRRPSLAGAPKRGVPVVAPKKIGDDRRRAGKIDVQAALEGEDEKVRSLASVRRQRERERRQAELELLRSDGLKVVREVILPETITVQEDGRDGDHYPGD
jgi:translation initiation factor IF-2